jgi:hypothetical protein
VLLIDGCQYDYSSPLPGLISVRLRTKSENFTFDPLNNFVLKVAQVEAVRNDGARAEILEDTKAISRTTNTYNTLDKRARDSSLIMGEAYLPPGEYIGVNMLVEPGTNVTLDGYRVIPVIAPPNPSLLLAFRKNFSIKEGVTTRIVVTIDLDNALKKGANNYYFEPIRTIEAFRENFDSVSVSSSDTLVPLPAGWSRNIDSNDPASGAWGIRGDSSSSGYGSASSRNNCYSSYTQSSGSWVQTPPIEISQVNIVEISTPFIEFGYRYSAASKSTLTLQISPSASFSSYYAVPLVSEGDNKWKFFSSSLTQVPVGVSTVYVRWLVTGSGEQSDVRFDDVVVGGHRLSYYISSIQ